MENWSQEALATEKTPSAERFQALRETLGHTQSSLAELMGVARNTLASWESGARNMPAHAWRFLLLVKRVGDLERQQNLPTSLEGGRERAPKNKTGGADPFRGTKAPPGPLDAD